MDSTEKPLEKTEEELMLEALKRLHTNPDFVIWREQVAKPLIGQLENSLATADDMSEVNLRANLKQMNTLKALFYTWFENIK
jgi:hypothetical protein